MAIWSKYACQERIVPFSVRTTVQASNAMVRPVGGTVVPSGMRSGPVCVPV
jgi:hypothetical protein